MHQMVSSIPGANGAGADATAEEQQAGKAAAASPLLQKLAQSRPCSEMVLQGALSSIKTACLLYLQLPHGSTELCLHFDLGTSEFCNLLSLW
jgi:hypothetical protein